MLQKVRGWDITRQEIVNILDIYYASDLVYVNSIRVYNKNMLYGAEMRSGDDVILMQGTGLKDKYGIDIYEGDIVKNIKGEIGTVAYLMQEAGYVIILPQRDYRLGHRNTGENYDIANNHEVIGNVYANRDLLKGEINE